MANRADYVRILETAYAREKERVEEEREKALEHIRASTPLFGYAAQRWMLDYAATCAFLYARRGDDRLAQQAKDALFFYRDWRQYLPAGAEKSRPEYADGIPPMDMVFNPVVFVPAVINLRPALSETEVNLFVDLLAQSLVHIWRFPEWGGHNRAALRAACLAVSAQAFPGHPDAGKWASMADELVEESWGRWSIEDAMLYQAHWLRALIVYAEARGRETELKDMLQPRVYLKAMTQLISPLGILPDFGDSHWLLHSTWDWMACLEWGASVYGDPSMKWAAERIYADRQSELPSAYLSQALSLAWRWCDDRLVGHTPLNREDALDDLVLKKLVWRTGWDAQASYACLNYRDEGQYGRVARDFLRSTLAVSAEKMHHGHADEGSFSMLVHNGTLLLHESGYRENPPDGIYRSAVYHNRLVWQPGRQPEGQGLLEFLRGDGHYQPVHTERLYQTQLGDAHISRVRVTDEVQGLSWDRSIFFLPGFPCWVVLDNLMAARTGARTLSALWWTTELLSQGGDWFDTHVKKVMDWSNPQNAALLVSMPAVPGSPGELQTLPFRRHFQEEIAITRTWFGELRAGRFASFVTLLWPHAYGEDPRDRAAAVEVIESQPAGRGVGVRLTWAGEERLLAALTDLTAGFRSEDVRPTYSAALGTVDYAGLSSDAAFVYRRRAPGKDWAGFINGTFLASQGHVLFESPVLAVFQENRTALPGVLARFRWETPE